MDEIKVLTDLGFAVNEAKVYLTMLASGHAQNGYEIARTSGVTRTMIYDILHRLHAKRAIDIIEAEPRLYLPVDYRTLVANMRKQNEQRLCNLEEVLANAAAENSQRKHYVYNINGSVEIIKILKRNIAGAKREIYLSAWRDEILTISDDLREAAARGVKVYIFSFNELPFSFGTQYIYGFKWPNDKYFPRRRISAIFDRETMVMGEGSNAFEDISIVTENTMLIEMAIDQMLLDIWHLHAYKKEGLLRENMSYEDYLTSSRTMLERYKMPTDLPKTINS